MISLLALLATSVPLWITFDVANPEVVGGHRILHLEDVLGPDQRRDVPGLPVATAALLFSVRPADCGAESTCSDVAGWTAEARGRGGLVVAVVQTERDRATAVRASLAKLGLPIAVAMDPHGVVTALADLRTPGTFVVIDGKGRTRRWTPAAGRATLTERAIAQVRTAFNQAASP